MTLYYADDWLTVYHGDARTVMAGLEPESVNCVVTSPPYWGLRDYGVTPSVWDGEWQCSGRDRHPHHDWQADGRCGNIGCDSWSGPLGMEPTPELYVRNIVQVLAEARRVLRDDGTLWLNLGDSYAAARGGTHQPAETLAGGRHGKTADGERVNRGRADGYSPSRNAAAIGLKHKDLVGIPWMVAFALRVDGWYLRSDIIWSKPNPMPESVTDRPTKSHEYLFLLSKSARYYFDAEAVRIPPAPASVSRWAQDVAGQEGSHRANGGTKSNGTMKAVGGPRATDKQRGHSRRHAGFNDRWDNMERDEQIAGGANIRSVWTVATQPYPGAHFATFPPKLIEPCILAGCPEGGVVLDPFAGSGTTGLVAQRLSRRAVLIDLSMDYLGQLMDRNRDIPLGLETA